MRHRGFLLIYSTNHFVPKGKRTDLEKKKKENKPRRGRGDKEERGSSGEDEDKREVFEAQVFLIRSRLFTVGLPSGFHQGFMYNLT